MSRPPSRSPRSLIGLGFALALALACVVGVWLARAETSNEQRPAVSSAATPRANETRPASEDAPLRAAAEPRPPEGVSISPPPVESEPAPRLGAVSGRIVDANGEGLADLPVFLVRDDASEPRRTTCDLAGWFRFDGVPHGPSKLAAGGAKSPIVPALAFALDRDRLELEPIALPPLGRIDVLVVDDSGHAVPALEIHGQGDRGGEVHERTDAVGKALARFLPAGTIRIFANDAKLGRGNTALDLAPGASEAMTITLRHGP